MHTIDAQVSRLCADARNDLMDQKPSDAARKIQAAASLNPTDARVQSILRQLSESHDRLLPLCDKFLKHNDLTAARQILAELVETPVVDLDPCLSRLLVPLRGRSVDWFCLYDEILSRLINISQKSVAARLAVNEGSSVAALLETDFIGEKTAAAVVNVLLLPDSKVPQDRVCRAFFNDLRSGKPFLSALVPWFVECPSLPLREDDIFFLFQSLATSSQSLIILAKILEQNENVIHLLHRFVLDQCAMQTAEAYISAFSAAAALFPVTPAAISLFLQDNFLPSLMQITDPQVLPRAIDMLNAACVDTAARKAIRTHCLTWLQSLDQANVVLTKLEPSAIENQELVERLIHSIFADPQTNFQTATEGLAHASLQPEIKEFLVRDRRWLSVFLSELGRTRQKYGGLVVLHNLTAYLPVQTEEQRKMTELKAYAEAQKIQIHRLDEDEAVLARCNAIIDADVSSVLFGAKDLSATSLSLVLQIALSLSRSPRQYRLKLVKGGGIKMLINAWQKGESPLAAQALARLLISTDPSVYFGPTGNALLLSAIAPLVSLLHTQPGFSTGPVDRLPTFEALLALTNLASVENYGASKTIVATAMDAIDELVLHSNGGIQRAAVELLCNMVQTEEGVGCFVQDSPVSIRRSQIMLALTGCEDLATRKAAGGAMAQLTQYSRVVQTIVQMDRGVDLLLAMLDEQDSEMMIRAAVCLAGSTMSENPAADVMRKALKDKGADSRHAGGDYRESQAAIVD